MIQSEIENPKSEIQQVYCLSGLGADERIFRNLKIPGATLVHLPWCPFDKHDEMSCYAQKMAAQIKEETPIVLGLSFGGMIATEIAKLIPVKQLFLISSAKTKDELPELNSMLKFLVNNKLMPYSLFKKPNSILYRQFGATTPDEKQLLNDIMKDTDPSFLGWAFRTILNWQNQTIPQNYIHIHGTADKIIQPAFVTANYWIREGSHMMVYNKAEPIAKIIAKHL